MVGNIREAEEGSRWRTLLESECKTAREFQACWEGLQGEARDCAAYLGEELDGPLAVPVEGAGEGRVDGSTRVLVTQQRESLTTKVLHTYTGPSPSITTRLPGQSGSIHSSTNTPVPG